MKRLGIILGIILLSMFLIFFLSTCYVERASYFHQDYYQKTAARIDSFKSAMVIVNDSIQAGFAKISITPSLNNSEDLYREGKFIQVPLAGFGARKGKSATGIHDSVFVKAVALKVDRQTLVFVSADLLIMPPNIIDSVTILLSKGGILRQQMFFSATHSHSSLGGWGPGYIGEQFAGKENKNLERWLVLKISKAVTSAIADLRPARIGSGCFYAGNYTRNRVIGELGTKNNDFSFITLEQIGYKKAIIGSFSAHSTTMGSNNMEISADYPGYWERKIEDTSADLALFFAGSTGSQSPVGKGDGFDKPKYIGEALADSLNVHLPRVVLNDKITFSSVSLKIQLPEYHMRITTKINLSSYLSKKLMPPPENVYLQAIRIDNMVWITTPCDFSGEYALQIKNALAAKGFNSNVTSFNGSYVGYIVPGRYFYLNEYEPKLMGWFGPNMGEYTMDLIRQISKIVTNTDNI
ncbi:MAG: neutral/alkaline non-lysosomal ceramidase N-terminal domain-containing protein [Bacteroidales bacterium]|nr:neutral/alkaline non-lysosomal ceramidase N-terminal domain-containing protein [Bacteroidales bacterium]MDP3003711.1 neutral/alkaline non-lysosomal ceramidase N-terminal domain-containing protein [Bacteroidales bacterium]